MESDGNSDNGGGSKKFSNLTPVPPEESGVGLPYAPENFPNPGDIWRWKAGKRISNNGNFRDRYLYLPPRLSAPANRTSFRGGFASKLAVERYVRERFPKSNISDFFASFSWRIPSGLPGNMNPAVDELKQFELEEQEESNVPCDIDGCKAGNHKCSSLILEKESPPVMPCDFCCAEPKFCRECCCILCYKAVDSTHGGCSYIMCKVKHDDTICGHVAHLECAFRAYMAGTLGGMIGLDAEYFCRRCNGRTELIPHVYKLLLTCESIDSDDVKETFLNLGINLLHGSEKAAAKELMSRIALAVSKLKCGTNIEDILNVGDKVTAHSSGSSNNGEAATEDESPLNPSNVVNGTNYFRYRSEVLKIEADIDQGLEALRKSQKHEYKLAEENLRAHTKYLQNLLQQLNKEKSELACQPNTSHSSVLFQTVEKREEQLRQAMIKFEEMKKVVNGFGGTPKTILEKHFGL
ncbi:unnamed protein product [Trifolium pratense]|uniref:Uncharacterized protein n=1 Tax=Trifolium pratense TaxID=57577 RepID=A0ACB0IDT2_TRIPR|nr:unnamed protein product [Trifolium pratense]